MRLTAHAANECRRRRRRKAGQPLDAIVARRQQHGADGKIDSSSRAVPDEGPLAACIGWRIIIWRIIIFIAPLPSLPLDGYRCCPACVPARPSWPATCESAFLVHVPCQNLSRFFPPNRDVDEPRDTLLDTTPPHPYSMSLVTTDF